ncbi:TPA: Rha family transcriptional regulator [Streptococcus suis]|nr:Rha family transcriptional regulator [Streptococcus suis]HEM6284973.1 Rha family transcriptional regulator [Streptococcus suis]HEM6325746.1 Rha family transcriptional regulator [Streptococcus suis]
MNNFMTIGTGHTMTTTDGTQYISSRDIAEWTEKRHDHLIRDIEKYICVFSDGEQTPILGNGITPRVEGYFIADTYQAEDGGRAYKMFWCSRKGCEMIANKMTGKKGILFTAQYIEAFHAMEKECKKPKREPKRKPIGAREAAFMKEFDIYQRMANAERFYVDTLAQAIAETTDMLEKSYLTHKLTKFMQEVAH